MPKLLSTDAVERYDRDGYVCPVDILSPLEVAHYGARLAETEAKYGRLAGKLVQRPHQLFTWVADLVRHPRILDAAEDLLGPDLLVWGSTFFNKEARDPAFVSWHQDSTYWGLDRPKVLTVWVALTPATRENGCMKIIPGTHHVQAPHRDTFERENLLSRGQEIAVDVDERSAVYLELKPGQASVHHVMLHHGSAPNTSSVRRVGLAIRYIAAGVRNAAGRPDTAALVRGSSRPGDFLLEGCPDADMSPAAVAAHEASGRIKRGITMEGTDAAA